MNKVVTKFKEAEIGTIPEEWNIVSLGSIAEFNQGLQVPTEDQLPAKENGAVRFIRIVDFTKGGDEPPRYIKNVNNGNYNVEDDDLIMIRYGSQTAGKIVRGLKGIIANNMFKISLTDITVDKDYLYTYLSQKNVYDSLNKAQSSSTMPAITFGMISMLPIPIPPRDEQKQIAEILSSLDDKIELNRKINTNLEKLSSSLFKQWFVDFEFPNGNNKPYKSSGGKMVDSELGEIPEGFEIKRAISVLDFIKGVEPGAKKYFDKFEDGMIPFYRVGDMFNGAQSIIYINKNDSKNVCCDYGDVLISTDGTVGRVVTGISGVYSGGIRKVVSLDKSITNGFIYFWLKSQYVQDKLKEHASSATTIAHASGALSDFIIPCNNTIVGRFGVIVQPIFDQFQKNLEEIIFLSNLRDSLLPRLMSGKIRV